MKAATRSILCALCAFAACAGLAATNSHPRARLASVKYVGAAKISLGLTPADIARISAQAKREQLTGRTITADGWAVEVWRKGEAVRVVSNRVHQIVGAKLKSTFTERIAAVEAARDQFRQRMEEWKAQSEAWEAVCARREAAARAVISYFEEQRDKAVLPTTKAIYQAVIDKLNERLNGE